jgi:hypothetical protein
VVKFSWMHIPKLALVVLMLLEPVKTLKFDLHPTKVKCFSEDIPDSTLVLGNYDVQYMGEPPSSDSGGIQPVINVQVGGKSQADISLKFFFDLQTCSLPCFSSNTNHRSPIQSRKFWSSEITLLLEPLPSLLQLRETILFAFITWGPSMTNRLE